MRKLIAPVLVFGVIWSAAPALAHMKMHCKPETGMLFADPIVSHNAEGNVGHLHTFLANTSLPLSASPDDVEYSEMVGQPTTCQFAADSAAYWFPTLLQNGIPVPVFRFIAYYRSWQFAAQTNGRWNTGTGNVPYPPDSRLVAGDMMAPGGGQHVNWTCNTNSSRPGPWDDPIDAACNTATGTVYLGAHIDFPSCYSGVLNSHVSGQTADFNETPPLVSERFAYPVRSGDVISCPPGFPITVPALRMTLQWDYQGDGTDLQVSSALMGGDRFGMHADFWNTWVHTGLTEAINRCINSDSPHPHGDKIMCGS